MHGYRWAKPMTKELSISMSDVNYSETVFSFVSHLWGWVQREATCYLFSMVEGAVRQQREGIIVSLLRR